LNSPAIEHLWDVVERELRTLDVHPTNLHQLQDAILSVWANISKEYFSTLLNHCHVAVLKAKGDQTYLHGVSMVFLIILYVSVYCKIHNKTSKPC